MTVIANRVGSQRGTEKLANMKRMKEQYLAALKAVENSEQAVVPSDQIEGLKKAALNLLELLERVSLFAAAVNTNAKAMDRRLAAVSTNHPEAWQVLQNQFGGLLTLRKQVLESMDEESDFTMRLENMVRAKMLAEAGVDPNDSEAAWKYMQSLSEAFVISPGKKN